MPQCYVETCGNYYEKTRGSNKIIYHMLPGDPVLMAKWIRACGKKEQKRPSYARVCSDHFSEKCYQRDLQHELLGLPLRRKLKPGAIPDKNLPKHQNPKTEPKVRESGTNKMPDLSSNKQNFPTVMMKLKAKENSDETTNLTDNKQNTQTGSWFKTESKKKLPDLPRTKKETVLENPLKIKDQVTNKDKAANRRISTKIYDFKASKTKTGKSKKECSQKIQADTETVVLKEKEDTDHTSKINNKMNKLPMRSSFRIAKKKSIECLSDSFTEKVNSKSKDENKPEKFTDKLKFMAKLQLKFERKENFVPVPEYNFEVSLDKIMKRENFPNRHSNVNVIMPQCAVVDCNSTHRRTKGGSIKYHRFPGDSGTRNQWLAACGRSLNNCSTARICSRHFSLSSYERDVQHELLGLPTRCRLKRGAIPDQNLPSDFLKEEKQQESAIAILLAVGLVPTNNQQESSGGLPQDLNKMQIMEDVREGCDANPPSSPGHAEQRHVGGNEIDEKFKTEDINENGVEEVKREEDENIKEVVVKEEKEEKPSDDELENKHEENSSNSSSSESNNKRKLEEDDSPIKRLKTEIQDSFVTRDKIINDFIEMAECNSMEQINSFSEQILMEIKTLNELAKEKEREWNHLLHMKKIKEELLIRLQRKRQVLLINDSDLSDFQSETNGQQSLLKCNQKINMLRDLRATNMEKLKQRTILPKPHLDINSSLDLRQKQKPLVDVQSIIADYRQRHPEVVPRRGRRIRHSHGDDKTSILGLSGGTFTIGQKSGLDSNSDLGLFLNSINGSQYNSRSSTIDSTYPDNTSYKDILVQFAKLSQRERTELQMHLKNTTKPPPPYPEVTVHPVTSTSSVAPTNSLLHGILTKTPVRQNNYNNANNNEINNGSKTSFSPTLARLLTAPEKAASNLMTSMPTISGMNSSNMSISEIFCGGKARSEITITPVGSQYETTQTKKESMEEESEEHLDRLVIDETSENPNSRSKEDNSSDNGDEVPQCQGCNQKAAQFVCAGCGNQWYCSRNCQVTAWDEHSEVCSG